MKRPPLTSRGSSQPKKRSSLRLSFEADNAAREETSQDTSEFTPKKSSLSRRAIEKNALRKSLCHSLPAEKVVVRGTLSKDRPSYSKDYLEELRSSTPSTPRDVKSPSPGVGDGADDPLGVLAKFGSRDGTPADSSIPGEAEIREKKERRARLAREQEYIGVDDEDEEDENEDYEIALRPRQKWAETRLVREDEDVAEGFDDFVEDGTTALGRKAEKEQEKRRRAEMRELIEQAEGSSDEESDDSEVERRQAYDAAQTRAGTYRSNQPREEDLPRRPRTPPKITPLPSLSACLERLQGTLKGIEDQRARRLKELDEITREREEIAVREVEIQRLLKEAGEKYEKLRAEAGIAGEAGGSPGQSNRSGFALGLPHGRGLEDFGSMQSGPLNGY